MAISDQLTSINASKQSIKAAIEAKGVTVGTTALAGYAAKINSIASTGAAAYVRPTDWLTMPSIAATEQKIAMLVAVYDIEPNWVVFSVTGACTVDWGDGTVENFASGANASHTYVYANISAATTTTRGYRQALITVTMQAGQTLTAFAACGSARHPASIAAHINPYLDIVISAPSATSININAFGIIYGNAMLCERVEIKSCGSSPAAGVLPGSCFSGIKELREVIYPATITANGSALFSGCNQIETIPPFILATTGSINSIFNGCFMLTNNPAITWTPQTGSTLASQSFQNCGKLTDPKLTIAGSVKVTNTSGMFTGCAALVTMPSYDLSAVTDASSMFSNCYALRNVVPLNLSAATTLASMFSSCFAMEVAPVLTTTSALLNISSMFTTCVSLTRVPNFFTNNVTNFGTTFSGCAALMDAGSLDARAATALSTTFGTCANLAKGGLVGTNNNHSYAACRLSGTELNTIYTNLSATGTSKSITVTGNYGAATDTPTIATAKSWTVIG